MVRNAFPFFHLLESAFSLDDLAQLTSAQLAGAWLLHPDYDPATHERKIKKLWRARREKGRTRLHLHARGDGGGALAIGVNAPREERLVDPYPGFELIDLAFPLYDDDLDALSSAQLAVLPFHPDFKQTMSWPAEVLFTGRRERDLHRGLRVPRADDALPVVVVERLKPGPAAPYAPLPVTATTTSQPAAPPQAAPSSATPVGLPVWMRNPAPPAADAPPAAALERPPPPAPPPVVAKVTSETKPPGQPPSAPSRIPPSGPRVDRVKNGDVRDTVPVSVASGSGSSGTTGKGTATELVRVPPPPRGSGPPARPVSWASLPARPTGVSTVASRTSTLGARPPTGPSSKRVPVVKMVTRLVTVPKPPSVPQSAASQPAAPISTPKPTSANIPPPAAPYRPPPSAASRIPAAILGTERAVVVPPQPTRIPSVRQLFTHTPPSTSPLSNHSSFRKALVGVPPETPVRISRGAPRFDRTPSASLTAYTAGVFKHFAASYHAAVAAGAYDAKESLHEPPSDLSELSNLTESDSSDDDSSDDLPLALVLGRIKSEPVEKTVKDLEITPPEQAPQDGGVAVPESPAKLLEASQLQPLISLAPAFLDHFSLSAAAAASPTLDSPPLPTTPALAPPADDEVPMDLDSVVENVALNLIEQHVSSPLPPDDTSAVTESLSQPRPAIAIEPARSLSSISASEPARAVSCRSESTEPNLPSEPRQTELGTSALAGVLPAEPILAGSTACPPTPVPCSLQSVAHVSSAAVISAPGEAQPSFDQLPAVALAVEPESEPPATELETTTAQDAATELVSLGEAGSATPVASPDLPALASTESLEVLAAPVDAILQDSTPPIAPVAFEESVKLAVYDAAPALELPNRHSSPSPGPAAVLVDLPAAVAFASTAGDQMHVDVPAVKALLPAFVELVCVKAEPEEERVPAPLAPSPVRLNTRGRPSANSIWHSLAPVSIDGPLRPIVDGAPQPVPELPVRSPPPPALLEHPEVCAALFFEQMDAMIEQAGPRPASPVDVKPFIPHPSLPARPAFSVDPAPVPPRINPSGLPYPDKPVLPAIAGQWSLLYVFAKPPLDHPVEETWGLLTPPHLPLPIALRRVRQKHKAIGWLVAYRTAHDAERASAGLNGMRVDGTGVLSVSSSVELGKTTHQWLLSHLSEAYRLALGKPSKKKKKRAAAAAAARGKRGQTSESDEASTSALLGPLPEYLHASIVSLRVNSLPPDVKLDDLEQYFGHDATIVGMELATDQPKPLKFKSIKYAKQAPQGSAWLAFPSATALKQAKTKYVIGKTFPGANSTLWYNKDEQHTWCWEHMTAPYVAKHAPDGVAPPTPAECEPLFAPVRKWDAGKSENLSAASPPSPKRSRSPTPRLAPLTAKRLRSRSPELQRLSHNDPPPVPGTLRRDRYDSPRLSTPSQTASDARPPNVVLQCEAYTRTVTPAPAQLPSQPPPHQRSRSPASFSRRRSLSPRRDSNTREPALPPRSRHFSNEYPPPSTSSSGPGRFDRERRLEHPRVVQDPAASRRPLVGCARSRTPPRRHIEWD